MEKTPQFPLEMIPDSFMNLRLSQSDRQLLSQGEFSNLLENLNYEGKLCDAKIRLVKTQDGKLGWEVKQRQSIFQVPEYIPELNYRLTSEDKLSLQHAGTIGPIERNGGQFVIDIDKELNCVVLHAIRTSKDFNLGYNISLTEAEQKALSSGYKLPAKVIEIKDAKGNSTYFSANLAYKETEGKQSYYFYNHKPLTKGEAEKIKPTLEESMTLFLEKISSNKVKSESIDIPVKEKDLSDVNVQLSVSQNNEEKHIDLSEQENRAFKMISDNDMKALGELKKEGFTPSEGFIKKVCQSNDISEDKKIIGLTVAGVSEPGERLNQEIKELKQPSKVDISKSDPLKEKDISKSNDSRLGDKLGRLLNTAAQAIE